jgi:two-component system nitrate/nitrite response regulator NarL
MKRGIEIVIADDHPLLRDGLRKLLDSEAVFAVTGEAANGHAAVEVTRRLEPDVLLLDLALPDLSGLDVLRALRESGVGTRTILLTASIKPAEIVKAFQIGAHGLVMKHTAAEVLMKAIRTVMTGQYWISRNDVSQLVETFRAVADTGGDQKYDLTTQELELIKAVTAGYTNKDIAGRLGLSEETVKHHLTRIFQKVGVSNRLELALLAISEHLLERP